MRGEGTSSEVAGAASLPGGLSLNALRLALQTVSGEVRPQGLRAPPSWRCHPGQGNVALALTSALAAGGGAGTGGWGRRLGRALQEGKWLYYGKGSSGSVVDPETSGHFGGGIWRQWGMVAPKLRSRWRTIGSRAGLFFLWAQLKVNCYHWSRELERKGYCSLALSTTHSCGYTSAHTLGYSCWWTRVAVHSCIHTHGHTHL